MISLDRYYGGHETLLHLALHLHLEQTSSFLLTDDIITNFKGILDLQGYDRKQPSEIARERGMSEISDRIVALTTVQVSLPDIEKNCTHKYVHVYVLVQLTATMVFYMPALSLF